MEQITKNYHEELQTEELAIVESLTLVDQSKVGTTLVPDNHAEIIVPLDRNLIVQHIGTTRPLNLPNGQGYFFLPRRRGLEILGLANFLLIKINPIYTKSFVHLASEFTDRVFHLQFGPFAIKELMYYHGENDVNGLNEFLASFIDQSSFAYNFTILDSIDLIRSSNGTISIKEIYSVLQVSKSKLENNFNRELGLTPKEFCKIEKINSFLEMYKKDRKENLTNIAYQTGYYDQSHLIRDFRYFFNTSPRKFLTAHRF